MLATGRGAGFNMYKSKSEFLKKNNKKAPVKIILHEWHMVPSRYTKKVFTYTNHASD